ncbi:response regulator transcription factor [Paenibacillus sp. TRM 82003]|nr:response regulator transcription factor [Paenibacillus sp. TRM 82003]
MIRILLVDDHPSVMEGTRLMLEKQEEFRVTLGAPDRRTIDLLLREDFDVMLFDLNMPGMNGIELTKEVLAVRPDSIILIYTGFDVMPHVHHLIELGVAGFVPKTATAEHLASAIHCAVRKEAVIPLAVLRELRKEKSGGTEVASAEAKLQVTARDIEILREVAKGKSNKLIAEKMLMSQRSLEYALTLLFQKLDVRSRVEAVSKAKQTGYIFDGDFHS